MASIEDIPKGKETSENNPTEKEKPAPNQDVPKSEEKPLQKQEENESVASNVGRADPVRKGVSRTFRANQGKTVHPRQRMPPKELRELSRKLANIERNLKIEGMPPQQPNFRKRRLSTGSSSSRAHEKDSPYKRKRLASIDTRKGDHMPKWEMVGGDAKDPLNLNGLEDTEEGRLLNTKTPESSPLPIPDFRGVIYVKVPPNIEDPLNLEGKHDQEEINRLLTTTIKKRHRTKKKKHDDSKQTQATEAEQSKPGPSSSNPGTAESSFAEDESKTDTVPDSAEPPKSESSTPKKVDGAEVESIKPKSTTSTPKKVNASDLESNKVKSEQSTPKKVESNKAKSEQSTPKKVCGRSRSRSISMSPEHRYKRQLSGSSGKGRTAPAAPTVPQFKYPDKPKFTLGNYNRYYGYRNVGGVTDPRLQFFDLKWFKGKDVLDIGCNAGHLTLALADQYQPHKILGMDIDGKLIQAARQNIRHILSQRRKDSTKYPRVLEMTRGPLEAHPLVGSSDQFPNNILFLQGNYIPGSEEILNLQKEEYDTILALSITKWIHLNNGDNGLKLFFRKIFRQLRPGGKLILEPQPWSTYRKRAKLSPEMFSNYQAIKLKPEGFKHYFLSIGFVKCEVIGVPVTKAKGFRRPLLLFTKPAPRDATSPMSTTGEPIDFTNICEDCGSEDKSRCDHPQFAGVRRGPYASYLYDHVNYRHTYQTDSPVFGGSMRRANSSHSFSASFGAGGFGGGGGGIYFGDFRDSSISFGNDSAPFSHDFSMDVDHPGAQNFNLGGDSFPTVPGGSFREGDLPAQGGSIRSRSSSGSGPGSLVSGSASTCSSGSQSGLHSGSSTPASSASSSGSSSYSNTPGSQVRGQVHSPEVGVQVNQVEGPAGVDQVSASPQHQQAYMNGDLAQESSDSPGSPHPPNGLNGDVDYGAVNGPGVVQGLAGDNGAEQAPLNGGVGAYGDSGDAYNNPNNGGAYNNLNINGEAYGNNDGTYPPPLEVIPPNGIVAGDFTGAEDSNVLPGQDGVQAPVEHIPPPNGDIVNAQVNIPPPNEDIVNEQVEQNGNGVQVDL